jgi:hypothetical protein
MPDFGADACARRAEFVFARTYAELRGNKPYAAFLAEITAELGLPVCRLGPASKRIRQDLGATISGPMGGLQMTLSFPAGAVPEPTDVILAEGADGPAPDNSGVLGTIFSINAFRVSDNGLVNTFDQPFGLSINYDDSLLGGLDESKLALFYWDVVAGSWVESPHSLDPEANLITAELDHLTTFAVRQQPDARLYLPLVVK